MFSFVYFFQLIIAFVVRAGGKPAEPESGAAAFAPVPLLWLFLFSLPFSESCRWFYGSFVIYEQAVVFALAFVMPSVYFGIRGLAEERHPFICLSSLLMSLAACTRGTWIPLAFVGIFPATYAFMKFRRESVSQGQSAVLGACLIFAIILLLGLFAVNYLKFDSLWDFGLTHQDSQDYYYQRGSARLFSVESRPWTFLANLLLYYAPMAYVAGLGLIDKSASVCEGNPIGFFGFAPQFLVFVILMPPAVYRMVKENSSLLVPFVVCGFVAVYINCFVAAFGTMVTVRFFLEGYFFLLIVFFTILLSLCPRKYGVIAMAALLAIYVPYNVAAFSKVRPIVNIVDRISDLKGLTDRGSGEEVIFIKGNVVWPKGMIGTENADLFRPYNLIGVTPMGKGLLAAEDVATAYIIPRLEHPHAPPHRKYLEIKGLRALAMDGTVGVFIDGKQVGRVASRKGVSVNYRMNLDAELGAHGPTHVSLVFFPGNHKHLPLRPICSPCFVFEELHLGR